MEMLIRPVPSALPMEPAEKRHSNFKAAARAWRLFLDDELLRNYAKVMTFAMVHALKAIEVVFAIVATWLLLSFLRDHLGRPVAWGCGALILLVASILLIRRLWKV
jgi:hypothetical protein